MATYKFEQFEIEIVNPIITIDGDVGTKVYDNTPQSVAYADIKLVTEGGSVLKVRLEDNTTPEDWTIESISAWVAAQLVKYESN